MRTRCPQCDFDLTGLELPRRCPECGYRVEPAAEGEAAIAWYLSRDAVWLRGMPPAAALRLDDAEVHRLAWRRLWWLTCVPVLVLVTLAVLLSMVEVCETQTHRWVGRSLFGERRGQSTSTDRFALTAPVRLDLDIGPFNYGLPELLVGRKQTVRTTYARTFGWVVRANHLLNALYWVVPALWAGFGVPLAAWVIRKFWRAGVRTAVCPSRRVACAFSVLLGPWVCLFVLLLGVQLAVVIAVNLRWLAWRGVWPVASQVLLATCGLYLLCGFQTVRRSIAAARSRAAPGAGLWSAAGALAWAVILLSIGAAIVLALG